MATPRKQATGRKKTTTAKKARPRKKVAARKKPGAAGKARAVSDPATEMAELYAQLQSVSSTLTEHYYGAIARYQQLAATTSPTTLGERYRSFSDGPGAEILNDIMQLGVRYGNSAVELSKSYYDRLFHELEGPAKGR